MGEGLELGHVLLHRPAPHARVELRQIEDLAVQPAEHVDMACPGGEVVPVVDGIRGQHVVVAGQDDDRLAQPRQLAPHEGDGLVGNPVVIEEIAGDQQQVDLVGQGPIDDARPDASAARAMPGLGGGVAAAVAVEVDVGGVQHAQRSS